MKAEGAWDVSEVKMARRLKDLKELKIERPPRIKLSARESLKRTKEFEKRKESFIAAVTSRSDE
jgi:hypothetical protein